MKSVKELGAEYRDTAARLKKHYDEHKEQYSPAERNMINGNIRELREMAAKLDGYYDVPKDKE